MVSSSTRRGNFRVAEWESIEWIQETRKTRLVSDSPGPEQWYSVAKSKDRVSEKSPGLENPRKQRTRFTVRPSSSAVYRNPTRCWSRCDGKRWKKLSSGGLLSKFDSCDRHSKIRAIHSVRTYASPLKSWKHFAQLWTSQPCERDFVADKRNFQFLRKFSTKNRLHWLKHRSSELHGIWNKNEKFDGNTVVLNAGWSLMMF